MARYTGPKTKIARKFGEPIFGDDKSFEKRNYPPGVDFDLDGKISQNGKICLIQLMFQPHREHSFH